MLQMLLIILLAMAWVPAVVFGARYMATGHLPSFGERSICFPSTQRVQR